MTKSPTERQPLSLRLRLTLVLAAIAQSACAAVLIFAFTTSDSRLLSYGFQLVFALLMTAGSAAIIWCIARMLRPVRAGRLPADTGDDA